MEIDNLYKLFIAFYKDNLSTRQKEEIKLHTTEVLEADAQARRAKKQELILSISKLRLSLDRLEHTYSLIKEECGPCDEVEQYIKRKQREINDLIRQKNSHYL